MSQLTLTSSQIEWFAERIDTSGTGRIIVKSGLVAKFKKIFPDSALSNDYIRNEIVTQCQKFI